MSPKANKKTEKRKQQRKGKNAGPSTSDVNMLQMHEQRNELALVKKQLAAVMSLNGMQKPAAASDTKIDEKYVKVPDAAQIALDKAKDLILSGLPKKNGLVQSNSDIERALETLSSLKEVIARPVVDEKEAAMKSAMHRLRQRGHNGGKYGALKPFSTIVVHKYTTTVTTTADATVYTVKPGAWNDFLTFRAVFDMSRVRRMEIRTRYTITSSTDVPTTPAVVCSYSAAFDPESSGAYTSVEQPLEAPWHTGPHLMTGIYGGFVSEKDQNWHVRKLPIAFASTNSTTMSDLVGGGWFDPNDSNMIIGYIKNYGDAPGTNVKTTITHYVLAECDFASRT